MSMIVRTTVALIGLSIAAPRGILAQATPATRSAPAATAQGKEELTVRVYSVTDLVTSPPDYPYRGSEIPTTSQSVGGRGDGVISLGGGGVVGGYGSGGGFGGGGFGGGGGFFQVSDSGGGLSNTGQAVQSGMGGFATLQTAPASRNRFTIHELVNAIESTIEPQSWAEVGGNAVCTPLGGLLIVKQTVAAHRQIEDLLESIGAEAGIMQTITIQAHWLLLTHDQMAQLLLPKAPGNGGAVNLVDGTVLEELARTGSLYSGQITCFSEQKVHLVSGDRMLVMTGAVPIVSAEVVGYQPVLSVPNIGVLLELKPKLREDGRSALLDLESTVTALGEERAPPIPVQAENAPAGSTITSSSVRLDRLNLETQHLATTIGMPIGVPVLVGGLSVAGGGQTTADPATARQLYLVVKLAVNGGRQ